MSELTGIPLTSYKSDLFLAFSIKEYTEKHNEEYVILPTELEFIKLLHLKRQFFKLLKLNDQLLLTFE